MRDNLESLTLCLSPEEIIKVERAALDDDAEIALELVKSLYERMLKILGRSHCMPYYELAARVRDGAKVDNPALNASKKGKK